MSDAAARDVLSRCYGIEPTAFERLESGSPNGVWKCAADGREFILKQCVFDASDAWFRFQEEAIRVLRDRGLPIQPLLPAKSGELTLRFADTNWQLRPFVPGRAYSLSEAGDLEAAAEAMSLLHSVREFASSPAGANHDLEDWLAAPDDMLKDTLQEVHRCADSVTAGELEKLYRTVLADARAALSEAGYRALPVALTHGEYHATNLIFHEGRMACILDWDAVEVRPRVYDVARAAFILTRKSRGQFKLTQEMTERYLSLCSKREPLTRVELEALVPILQFYFLPTGRYLRLIQKQLPNILKWYLGWSADGAAHVRPELAPVIHRLSAGLPPPGPP